MLNFREVNPLDIENKKRTVWHIWNKESVLFMYQNWKERSLPFQIKCTIHCRGESELIEAKCTTAGEAREYKGLCQKCGAELKATICFVLPSRDYLEDCIVHELPLGFKSLIQKIVTGKFFGKLIEERR